MATVCPKCGVDNPADSKFCKECAALLPIPREPVFSQTKTFIPDSKENMKGKTFAGRYQLIEELGRGGMGVVYKAEDTKLKRTVALKFLPPELTHIPEVHERFMREAQAAAALDHPNICTVYEFDEAEDKSFISMAYIEGQSLNQKIKLSSIGLEKALHIAEQIAGGLQAAHKKGIVHRDIKSANIMVTEAGQAKIMDFGLAKVAEGTLLTKEHTTMGTVAYMSPEQAQGKVLDRRTDIWSFGVVLYEMLTGQLPFQGEREQSVIHAILSMKPKPITELRPEIPVSIGQVIDKALEKNPEERYQQIDELLDDLQSISAGIIPEEIKTRLRKAKLQKRKRAILFSSAAALLILLSVLTLTLFTGRTEAIESIAVLPLDNLTGDAEKDFFAVVATEELIGQLGQISGLRRVISRTSVMKYKETDKTLSEIVQELNVDAVVEGSVQQAGDNVRIQVRLIDVLPEEQNLWGQTYERAISDVLVMYGEMARTIAENAKVELTTEEEMRLSRARQVNPKAYEACLKGMSHWYRLTPPDLDTAELYFASALEEDPDYALAHTGMFLVLSSRAQLGLVPPGDVIAKAKPFLEKALELDNTLMEAHFAKASMETWIEWDWEAAEASWLRAIELNPNYAMTRVYYSNLLCYLKRHEEAEEQGKRALELDPLNSLFMGIYANTLVSLGKFDEAIEQAINAIKTSPNDFVAHMIYWEALHMKKQYDKALVEAKAFYSGLGLTPVVEAMSSGYETNGYQGAMLAAAETLVAFSQQTYVGPWFIAYPYAAAGEIEKTLEWLKKGYEIGDPNMPYLGQDHTILQDLLRDDPRFQALIDKMNFPINQ